MFERASGETRRFVGCRNLSGATRERGHVLASVPWADTAPSRLPLRRVLSSDSTRLTAPRDNLM